MNEYITIDSAREYKGFLYKLNNNFFKTFQKRFFHILEGKLITYSKDENSEILGAFKIEFLSDLVSINDFEYEKLNLDSNLLIKKNNFI
jgi:hypothetical protein